MVLQCLLPFEFPSFASSRLFPCSIGHFHSHAWEIFKSSAAPKPNMGKPKVFFNDMKICSRICLFKFKVDFMICYDFRTILTIQIYIIWWMIEVRSSFGWLFNLSWSAHNSNVSTLGRPIFAQSVSYHHFNFTKPNERTRASGAFLRPHTF